MQRGGGTWNKARFSVYDKETWMCFPRGCVSACERASGLARRKEEKRMVKSERKAEIKE